jgi:glutathione synthase/RimK-type ligase-like ATP-grasp enzyme
MEIHHALGGLWVSLRDDCYWMSYPAAIRQASFKGGQLKRAAELGFDVPRTLITTAPEEAKAFIESCQNQVIFKVMSDPFLAEAKVMDSKDINGFYETTKTISRETSTTLITEQEISLLESVRYVNCQFQEFIPKKIELRITIIGDEIFAAEIHSQAHEKTKIDWRHYHVEIPYRKATLPLDLQSRCIEFVRSYNLNFSAMDFILTPDGRYVFIESNPNGQFLFIEQQIPELRMADALASCLIHGSNQCC